MIALTRYLADQFIEEQAWTVRARMAERVATEFAGGGLTPAESHAALDLIRLAAQDAEPLVRRVLAESLKRSRHLPQDIVRTIAADLPDVSFPFLAASPLLGERELLPLARSGTALQRAAIARRPGLTQRVTEALFGRTAA